MVLQQRFTFVAFDYALENSTLGDGLQIVVARKAAQQSSQSNDYLFDRGRLLFRAVLTKLQFF